MIETIYWILAVIVMIMLIIMISYNFLIQRKIDKKNFEYLRKQVEYLDSLDEIDKEEK